MLTTQEALCVESQNLAQKVKKNKKHSKCVFSSEITCLEIYPIDFNYQIFNFCFYNHIKYDIFSNF